MRVYLHVCGDKRLSQVIFLNLFPPSFTKEFELCVCESVCMCVSVCMFVCLCAHVCGYVHMSSGIHSGQKVLDPLEL